MGVLKLGMDPEPLEVILTKGGDFNCVLTYIVSGVVTSWPVGTAISLVFADSAASVWSATVVTSTATFDVDKATADAMADGTPVVLRYVNGTTDQIWHTGKVSRRA